MNTALNISMPLTLIKEPLETMYEKSESALLKKDFQSILQQIRDVDHFFSRLVNIERIDVINGQLRLVEIEFNAYLSSIINYLQPYAKKRNVQLIHRGDCELTSVWLDTEKIELIVKGLLTNIIDQTPAGVQVEIVTLCLSDNWTMEINSARRCGLKLNSNDPTLDYPCYESTDGLGWNLIRKLVSYHKGRLLYRHKKRGEVFVKLTLPITIKPSSTTPRWFSTTKVLFCQPSATTVKLLEENQLVEQNGSLVSSSEAEKRKYSILLIEERDNLRTYLQRVLSDNYSVIILSEGEKALDVVHRKSPDLVLSAAILTGMSGYEFCVKLKADEMISHIPVILFAEPSNNSDFLKGLYNSADLYLTIPFSISVLRDKIDRLIVNREIIRRKYIKLALEIDSLGEGTGLREDDVVFIARVRHTIERCLMTPDFNVDVLCAQMNMSRSGFYARMKATVNQAPADYIRTVRMSRALRLLLSKEHTVVEVGELTGFSDTKYFREVFKRYYGASPLKYTNSL